MQAVRRRHRRLWLIGSRLRSIKGYKRPKKSAYTDTFFRNFFAMQRTGKKYTVRFPLWETSQVATGEKLDDNTGLIMEASTITEKGRDDYETIPLFPDLRLQCGKN